MNKVYRLFIYTAIVAHGSPSVDITRDDVLPVRNSVKNDSQMVYYIRSTHFVCNICMLYVLYMTVEYTVSINNSVRAILNAKC